MEQIKDLTEVDIVNEAEAESAEAPQKRRGGPGRPKGAKDRIKRKKPYWLEQKPVPIKEMSQLSPQAKKEIQNMEDGTNKRILEYAANLDIIRTQALKNRNDIVNLRDCFQMFKALCYNCEMRPTNQAAFYALGFSASSFRTWKNGKARGQNADFQQLADDIAAFCGFFREQLAMEGKIAPLTNIWLQKNYDGMTDQQGANDNNTLIEAPEDPKQIAARYKDMPID